MTIFRNKTPLLAMLLSLLSSLALGQESCTSSPQLHQQSLAGTLTRADFETYVEVPFTVPAGTRRIEVSFDYDRSNRTTVDLGLLDPNGFRGWSGGNKSEFFIEANRATASFNTGTINAGTWQLLLGIPNIRDNQTATYSAQITLRCDSTPDTTPIPGDRGVDWYVGELHAHSGHSDGSCSALNGESILCPAELSLEAAQERGLDFIAMTEHNSVSQTRDNPLLQDYYSDLLLIPGREVTTFYGHANVFGSTEFIDFRLQPASGRGADFLQQQVEELGALMSINHPGSPSGEDCMGCGWVLPETDYTRVAAIEVVNAGFVDLPRGQAHIDFWHRRLNEGHRLTGIGGSDSHLADRNSGSPSAIGNPTTWVYADQLSVAGILHGIRRGNVFVEVIGGRTTLTGFSANGQEMGSTISLADEDLEFIIGWEAEPGTSVRFIHMGEVIQPDSERLRSNWTRANFDADQLQAPGWLRFDLVNEAGNTLLIGNPVYLEP